MYDDPFEKIIPVPCVPTADTLALAMLNLIEANQELERAKFNVEKYYVGELADQYAREQNDWNKAANAYFEAVRESVAFEGLY